MYISKFLLDVKEKEIKDCLQDCNKMHKFTWRFFDVDFDFCVSRSNLELLYRVVYSNNNVYLYLQSKFEPTKAVFGITKLYSVDSLVLFEKLKQRDILTFNMLVNPVIQVDKKRRFLVLDSERDYWLNKYSLKNGFKFINYTVVSNVFLKVKKSTDFTINGLEYQGQLKITDYSKFIDFYKKGIGPEKAYGFGMILLG